MSRRDSASTCPVRRSRRPQTRLETSCTRTGRPRRHLRSNTDGRSAGEGPGRTARVDVYEEAHCRRKTINNSHKKGSSLAEREEGRMRVKENTARHVTYPRQPRGARCPL